MLPSLPGGITQTSLNFYLQKIDIEDELSYGKVRDSNSYSLYAQIKETGCIYISYGIVKDNKNKLKSAITKAVNDCDLILLSGGVSVGDYDYIKEILNDMRAEEIFWGVKQKPGKPLAFYILDKKLIFGLPGNPVSSMVCFEIYVRPLIRKMMGYKNLFRKEISATLINSIKNNSGRTEFIRVVLEKDGNGNYLAKKTGDQGSGILTSMAKANGILKIDGDKTEISKGESIKVLIIKDDLEC